MKRLLAAVAALLLVPALAVAAPDFMEKAKPPGPPADTTYVFLDTMSSDEGVTAQAYLELPKAAPVDGRLTLWTATVPPAETVVDGRKGWLMLVRLSFDCGSRQHRWAGGVILNAADEVVETDDGGEWIDTEPESMVGSALKLACKESEPPTELLIGAAAVRADAAKRYRD